MAKYDVFRDRLAAAGRPTVVLYMWELDEMLPTGLPPSAREHRAWWANEADSRHVQASAWLAAGFRVADVVLPEGPVTFRRM